MNSRERLASHASHAIQFFVTVAVIKTKSATIAFSFFNLFFSLIRCCDFGAYRAQTTSLLTPFTQIIARSVSKNWLDIQFNHQ